MPSNLAAIKAKARRDIHKGLSVAAQHRAVSSGTLTDIDVRWHSKQVLLGDLSDTGYASIIEGIERIIFNRDELQEKAVVLREGDIVILTAPEYDNTQLALKVREETRGPVEIIWQVVRL